MKSIQQNINKPPRPNTSNKLTSISKDKKMTKAISKDVLNDIEIDNMINVMKNKDNKKDFVKISRPNSANFRKSSSRDELLDNKTNENMIQDTKDKLDNSDNSID